MKPLLMICAIAVPSLASAEALPKPVEALQSWVGVWKGAGTMTMGKDKVKVDLTWTCKPTSGKLGVTCTGALKGIPGLAVYEETDLFGYESNTDTYHWYAVTNAGETHDHVAKSAADFTKPVEFVFSGTQEGKPMKEVIDVSIKDGTLALKSETFVAGQSVALLEAAVRK